MLLKKTSSSWSLSKSAAMTVRTGDGMENLGVAMSCVRDRHRVTSGTGSRTPGPALVLYIPSPLGIGAQSQIWAKPGPLAEDAHQQSWRWGGPGPSPHPKSDAARGPTLQVEAVRPIPVAVDDVHPAITVEVSQCHATSMLVGVIQPWGAARGWGEKGPPPYLRLPRMPPRMCPVVPRQVLPTQGCIPAPMDALVHLSHPQQSVGLCVPRAVPPTCAQPAQAGRASPALGTPTPGSSPCSPYSPTAAATSWYVPSPRLWKRKLGLFSLPQNMSEALSLRMGPTATPRPPGDSSLVLRGQLAPCPRGVHAPHTPTALPTQCSQDPWCPLLAHLPPSVPLIRS